jgi:hypothetical protein
MNSGEIARNNMTFEPSSAASATTSAYWDKFAGTHLNNPTHWGANEAVRRFQWKLITGDSELNR